MKTSNVIAVALAATLYTAGLTSCGDDYDDTGIKDQISALDKRVTDLETKVKTDISAIQATIATINGNDFVKSVKEVEGGYEITFSKGTVAVVKKLTTLADPVLTVAQDADGKFYWKSNGEWLMDKGAKVPVSLTPDLKIKDFEGHSYWQINGEWLLGADGKKIEAVVSVDPIQLNVKENADGSITFVLGDKEYRIPVAAGGLVIVDPLEGIMFNGTPLSYQVALPTGWTADDLDVVRADVESLSASGVGITRAGEKWEVGATKTATGATVTVTGTAIPANEVAELTVTFVKKSGERMTGSIFATVWATNTAKQTITLDGTTTVASAIKGYMDLKTVYSNLDIAGTTAISAADWQALKDYKYLSTLTISNSTASAVMPADAFKGCTTLTTVVLTGSTFEAIPAGAFEGCIGLTAFTGTANITAVGANAFKGCEELTTLNTVNAIATVGNSAFEGCKKMAAPTLATLTSIGQYAFSGCQAMTTLPTLDATLTALPAGVFKNCKGLSGAALTVSLADITTIGNEAFFGCPITSATFAAATTIGNSAFYGCNKMTAATLEKVATIGNEAFAGCKLMTTLKLGTVTSVGTDAFMYAAPSKCTVTLGKGTTVGNPDINLSLWLGTQWDVVTVKP